MFDIIIIGGGASGLAAACECAGCGLSVAVLERNPRVGKKLLTTGNGRCNLGNENITERFFNGDFGAMNAIITDFDVKAFFAAAGLYTLADDAGRLYPRSNAAASVLDALRFRAVSGGVSLICDCRVGSVRAVKGGFELKTETGSFSCRRLICAAGGASVPSSGSDGYSYSLARAFGHSLASPAPSLCRLKSNDPAVKILKGQRVSGAAKIVCDGIEKRECGEIQFGDGTLSGICVFNLSRSVSVGGARELSLDLLPDIDVMKLEQMLGDIMDKRALCEPDDLLTGLLPKRAAMALLRETECNPQALARKIKSWSFQLTGADDWREAQTTAGGVTAAELDGGLRSRLCKGLYFTGEAVNIDGDCGGYNLHWAWSSGAHAAREAVRSLRGG